MAKQLDETRQALLAKAGDPESARSIADVVTEEGPALGIGLGGAKNGYRLVKKHGDRCYGMGTGSIGGWRRLHFSLGKQG
mgnify:CR=1 FL=1